MKERIREAVKESGTLNEVRDNILAVIKNMFEIEGVTQIGYVSGIITSDGPEKISENLNRLQKFTDLVRKTSDFPIFSSIDVISDELFKRLGAAKIEQEVWRVFWREVLQSPYVTDMFMTPGWEQSRGALDEFQTAKATGKTLHYFNYQI